VGILRREKIGVTHQPFPFLYPALFLFILFLVECFASSINGSLHFDCTTRTAAETKRSNFTVKHAIVIGIA